MGRAAVEPSAAPTHDRQRCVGALLVRDGRVLLCHRTADRAWCPDVWDVPGGHVEPGEDEAAALARELREELGVDVVGPVGRHAAHLVDEAAGVELSVWVVGRWAGEVVNRAPDEHDDVRWFHPAEVRSLRLADPVIGELVERAAGGPSGRSSG